MRQFQTDTSKELVLKDLPVGTHFYVENGMWYGEIILIDGKKGMKNIMLQHVFEERDNQPNEVTILDENDEPIDIDIVDKDDIPY